MKKVILFADSDWHLYNFRRALALALQQQGHEVLLVSPPGDHVDRLRALGLRWEALPMRPHSGEALPALVLLTHLWRLFRRERPSLVHSFSLRCALYGSLAARLAGVPARINAVSGMGESFFRNTAKARLQRPWLRALMRVALGGPRARLIVQNSEDMALYKSARCIDMANVRLVAGAGAEAARLCDGDDAAAEGRPLRVLLSTRTPWSEGVAEFAAAAARLAGEGRRIEFLVSGGADRRRAGTGGQDAPAWMDAGLVQWLGCVDDLRSLLSEVDVVVLTRDGLQKTLHDAALLRLPLVMASTPGVPNLLTNHVDGLLVPQYDSDALAAAIARLHEDPALARRLGQAARVKLLALGEEPATADYQVAVSV